MIEAVNSTLANAQILRGVVEQSSTTRSYAANPERVQEAVSVPKAPYVSPYISLDINHNRAVLQIRDSETGDVVRQFPSDTRLEAETRQRAREASQSVSVPEENDFAEVSDSSQDVGVSDVSRAQIASQALNAGAQAGVENLSAGVSVVA